VPIWENTEFRIFIVQCVVAWATLLIAIKMCLSSKGDEEKKEEQRMIAGDNRGYAEKRANLKPNAPMLTFVTADEIYSMSLEELQSVPQEHLDQLPLDKRAIVKRRINDLVQAERAKKNK